MVEFKPALAHALLETAAHGVKLFLDKHGDFPPFGVVMGPDERTVDMVQALDGDDVMPHGEVAWRKADSLLTARLQQRARDPKVIATAQVSRLETSDGMMAGLQMTFASGFAVMLIPFRKGRREWELGKPIAREELLFDPQQLDFQPPLTPEAAKYLTDACDELDKLQEMLNRRWRLQAPHKVTFDKERSCLVFRFADRGVEAAAEVLGTYRPRDQSWNWAWDQQDIAPWAPGSAQVRALGDRLDIGYLKEPAYRLPDPSFLSLLTAVGVKSTQAIGNYVGAHGEIDDRLEVVYLVKGAKAIA